MIESRYEVAAAWGIFVGVMTLAAGPIEGWSSNPILGAVKAALTILMLPGLIASAIAGYLAVGAFINFIFHFGASWLLLFLLAKFRKDTAPE